MSYKVEAVVTDIFPTDKITDRFSKRVIWIKTDEQYPQVWEVQFANQNIDLLDNGWCFMRCGLLARMFERKRKFQPCKILPSVAFNPASYKARVSRCIFF